MRPRASQVAKTRLVETEEDVETYRPVLDAIKAAIGDRQAELARLEGSCPPSAERPSTRTMTSACRCTGLTPPHLVRG